MMIWKDTCLLRKKNYFQHCNNGKMNLTGLSGRINGVKIWNNYTGWDFKKWLLAILTQINGVAA